MHVARGSWRVLRLLAEFTFGSPDESQLMFLVFDLLHQDGVDLRGLPLSERKRDLNRLCRKSRVPFLKQVKTFLDGEVLFDYCNRFGFEGIVSKRRSSRYSSGPSRNWVKTKCPAWKRINAERWRIFDGPRKPALTEAQKTLAKKREELARVLERLQDPDLRPGLAPASIAATWNSYSVKSPSLSRSRVKRPLQGCSSRLDAVGGAPRHSAGAEIC